MFSKMKKRNEALTHYMNIKNIMLKEISKTGHIVNDSTYMKSPKEANPET